MEVVVYNNALRLTTICFMVIMPKSKLNVAVGTKLPIRHIGYGKLGIVSVEKIYHKHLFEIKDVEFMIADFVVNTDLSRNQLMTMYNISQAELMTLCLCKFVQRAQSPFQHMLVSETRNAGFELISQPQLFTS